MIGLIHLAKIALYIWAWYLIFKISIAKKKVTDEIVAESVLVCLLLSVMK